MEQLIMADADVDLRDGVRDAVRVCDAWRRVPVALIQSLLIGVLIAYYFLMGFE